MGELVNLKDYRAWKAQQKEAEEAAAIDGTLNELELLKKVLEGILKDLPDVSTSIMYVPIEPKMDAFLHKDDFDMSTDLDGYLTKLGLTYSEDDDREDT
tara:strand:+ start:297 stop:593 length:297 start_codon:yes stop_codon:yes gene_type:complete